MKNYGTFLKLFLGNLFVMLAILAVGGWFTYQRLDGNYQEESRQAQQRLALIAAEHFQEIWPANSPAELTEAQQDRVNQVCKKLLHDPTARLTIIQADGKVLGDSQTNPADMKNHRTQDRPEILAALSGKEGTDERRSDTTGVQYRYIAVPLMAGTNGRPVAAVRVALPIKAISEGESLLRRAVLWSALAGTLAAVLLGLLASWIWYAPLRRITQAARQIASGDLSPQAGVYAGHRLSDLAGAVNDMRDHLGKYLSQVASQYQDFQTVLANLQEGVIATDASATIVLMNQVAGELLSVGARDAAGKRLSMVVPLPEVLEFHDQATKSDSPTRRQIEIESPTGRRTVEALGMKIPSGPSNIAGLMVLRDVTDLAATAAIKTQFVANASHELRTPVATIRAAVDSLAMVDPGDRAELANIAIVLNRHVTRLEEMTKDLLDLHMVESARFPLRMQEIGLGELAERVLAQFSAPAKEKGVTLTAQASPPEHTIRSDRKLLELILRNLVDNAIKFTPAGGQVECAVEASQAGVTLRVRDTGCGIKPADQPRVFERFYQADASRTGEAKARGTGLGLAIVKHAAERLGAKIDLQSEMGRGTMVTVLLANL